MMMMPEIAQADLRQSPEAHRDSSHMCPRAPCLAPRLALLMSIATSVGLVDHIDHPTSATPRAQPCDLLGDAELLKTRRLLV